MSLLFDVIRDMFGRSRNKVDVDSALELVDCEPPPSMLRVFVEFPTQAPVTYHTLVQSLISGSTTPLAITPMQSSVLPLAREELRALEFGRMLVPWLCDFKGWALFLEADTLMLGDVAELFEYADDRYAVMQVRSSEAGEWNSVLLFNCGHEANRMLTPERLEDTEDLRSTELLFWLDEALIGELPGRFNHTVAYDVPVPDATLVHFPMGVPWHVETEGCEYSERWLEVQMRAQSSCSWVEIFGDSHHAITWQGGRIVPMAINDASARICRRLTEREIAPLRVPPEVPRSRAADRAIEFAAKALSGEAEPPHDAMPAGEGLLPYVETIAAMCQRTTAKSVLDYGCGRAEALSEGLSPDGSGGAVSLTSLWKVRHVAAYDPAWPAHAQRPNAVFDGVVCTRVLEFVPDDDVDRVLADLFGFASQFVFIAVACAAPEDVMRPDVSPDVSPNVGDGPWLRTPLWWRAHIRRARGGNRRAFYVVRCEMPDGGNVAIEG
jgi:hypothetical protein